MRKLTVDEIVTEVAKFGNIAAENQKNIRALTTIIIAEDADNLKASVQIAGTGPDIVLAAAYLLIQAGHRMVGRDNEVSDDIIGKIAKLVAETAIDLKQGMKEQAAYHDQH